MMRPRPLIISILVVLVLAGIYFYDIHREQSRNTHEKASLALFPISPSEIIEIHLIRGHTSIILKKQPKFNEWSIYSPVMARADNVAVTNLVETIARLRAERVIAETTNEISPYGLDNPAIKVELFTKGKKLLLLVGNKTPINDSVYVKTSTSSKVYTISVLDKEAFDKGLFDLRDKRLTTIQAPEIREIKIHWKGKRPWTLVKGNGLWHLRDLPEQRLNSQKVESLVKRITWTTVISFLGSGSQALEKYGLKDPEVILSISDGNRTETILLGQKDHHSADSIYAMIKDSSQVVIIKNWLISELPRTIDALKK